MKVPDWLAHLRRDRFGRPVPVVNRWGKDENLANLAVQHDRHIGRDAIFYFDANETEPDFTAQNPQRQRRSMVLGECQICGRPIPWRRRHLVLSSVSTRTITSPGPRQGWLGVTEPWLDRRCAEFAIEKCPALIRRGRDEDLDLISVSSRRDVDVLFTVNAIRNRPETWQDPPVMWAELTVRLGVKVA